MDKEDLEFYLNYWNNNKRALKLRKKFPIINWILLDRTIDLCKIKLRENAKSLGGSG